jgi:transposase
MSNTPRDKLVSLKTLAKRLDAHRSTVRRWLGEAGIQPVVLGKGPKGAIRYRWAEVHAWVDALERTT